MAANEDFRAARATAHDPYMDEPEEEELFDDEQPPRRSSRALPIVVASLAILGFVVIVYYAYQQGIRAGSEANPPIIKAEEGPTKVRPTAPGGMEVPNQDMKVYELGSKPGTLTYIHNHLQFAVGPLVWGIHRHHETALNQPVTHMGGQDE